MNTRRIIELGGIAAGVLMVAFGIASLVLGINARNTVGDELTREFIVGSPDMKPAEIEKAVREAGLSNVPIPSCDVGAEIDRALDHFNVPEREQQEFLAAIVARKDEVVKSLPVTGPRGFGERSPRRFGGAARPTRQRRTRPESVRRAVARAA
jgi:hypothetical protein